MPLAVLHSARGGTPTLPRHVPHAGSGRGPVAVVTRSQGNTSQLHTACGLRVTCPPHPRTQLVAAETPRNRPIEGGQMGDTAWFLVIGLLLTAMAFAGSVLKRGPAVRGHVLLGRRIYHRTGRGGMLDLRFPAGAVVVERLAEVAVLISLFTAGLKLRVPPGDRRWLLPLRLAFLSMAVTGRPHRAGPACSCSGCPSEQRSCSVRSSPRPIRSLASDVQVADAWRRRPRPLFTHRRGRDERRHFLSICHARSRAAPGCTTSARTGGGGGRWTSPGPWRPVRWSGGCWGPGPESWCFTCARRLQEEAVGLDDFLTLGLIALSFGPRRPDPRLRVPRGVRGAGSRWRGGNAGEWRRRARS